ncbi:peptidylprolyl isomerase [Lysobacter pythonis]|uniref:Periplasmic chaperone PpiD n=1 Tax=Solilutibacter pythonis TaxID=2483112 RepID=A0A3M2HYE7_9GAMM|nr:SurA N-terminal domain-containing protein [Lysobacter pythonis]RMH94751.1 peptidylprolyl isomerase [Lysobacter pythonis]
MLQALREKSSGWVATLILGILIVPFALFGINDYMGRQIENYAARVQAPPAWWRSAPSWWPVSVLWSKEDIGIRDFRMRFDNLRSQQRQQQGDAFDNREFESAENKRRVLDRMIDERLAQIAAREAGIVIPDAQVRRQIETFPEFQVDGKFNAQRYQSLLASLNPPMSPLMFQQSIREGLLGSSLLGTLAGTGFVSRAETERMMTMLLETRDVTAVLVPPAADDKAVADTEIAAWYKSHAGNYRAPETVTLEYVDVDAAKLPAPTLDDAQLRERYQAERGKFGTAEQRQVSHILIPVAANASAAERKAAQDKAVGLAREARAGADFAALARANSGDPGSKAQGGDLGWVQRDGVMPKPFEDAVFALQAGAVSDPVKTPSGWHVIRLREVRAGTVKPFEEVRERLVAEFNATGRERAYNDLLGRLVDDLMKNPTGFAEVAAKHGLAVQKTGPVPKGGGEGIAALPAVQRDAFSESRIADGGVSDPIEVGTDRSVLLRVVAHTQERAMALAQVRERVIADIRADRAGKVAEASAKSLVEAVRQGGALRALAAERKLQAQAMPGMARNMPVPTPEAAQAIFRAPRPAPKAPSLGQVRLPDGAWLVFQVDAVHAGKLDDVPEAQRAAMRQQLAAANGDQAARAYVTAMRKRLRIDVAESQL